MALLLGYGAGAINPYLAFETPRRHDPPGHAARRSTTRPRSRTTSRRSTRACSRSSRRWGSPPSSPTAAPRSSRRSGSTRSSWTATSPGPPPASAASASTWSPRRRSLRHHRAFPERPVGEPRARLGRRVPVAARRRVPPLQPGHRVQAPARHAQRPVHDLQGVHGRSWTTRTEHLATLRGLFELQARAGADPARGGRAGRGDPQALRHRAPCPTARSASRPTRRSPSP